MTLRGGDRNRRDGIVEATRFSVKCFFALFRFILRRYSFSCLTYPKNCLELPKTAVMYNFGVPNWNVAHSGTVLRYRRDDEH
jgi:hypothetical protein